MRSILIFLFLLIPLPILALGMGDNMPDISGTFGQGKGAKKSSILELQQKNRPMVVAFFSVTCIPCIREAPDLEELRVKFGPQKVQFLYVNLDPPAAIAKLKTFIKKTKTQIPLFFADVKKVKIIYEAYGMPKLIVVNSEKKIIRIYEGYHPELKEELSTVIQELLP